jgi:hypothetical protein
MQLPQGLKKKKVYKVLEALCEMVWLFSAKRKTPTSKSEPAKNNIKSV